MWSTVPVYVGWIEGSFVKEDIVVVLNEVMDDPKKDANVVVDVTERLGKLWVEWIANVTDDSETENGLNVSVLSVFEWEIDVTLESVLDVLSFVVVVDDVVSIDIGCVNMNEPKFLVASFIVVNL